MRRNNIVRVLADHLYNETARVSMNVAKEIAEDAVHQAEGAAQEYDITLREYGNYDPGEEALSASERNEGEV